MTAAELERAKHGARALLTMAATAVLAWLAASGVTNTALDDPLMIAWIACGLLALDGTLGLVRGVPRAAPTP